MDGLAGSRIKAERADELMVECKQFRRAKALGFGVYG